MAHRLVILVYLVTWSAFVKGENGVTDSSEVETLDFSGIFPITKNVGITPMKMLSEGSDLPTNSQFDGRETEDNEDSSVVFKIRILEFAGAQFARIYGQRVNYSDPFGSTFPVLEAKGIPFAEPPIQSLRFQRPALKLPQDRFQAVRQALPCPQLSPSGTVVGIEDCLYLNIFVPADEKDGIKHEDRHLPVLVWFHGESLQTFGARKLAMLSSGSSEDLLPHVFLQHQIIVVTPQYRLGSFGFLNVANEDLNGNMGAFDQLLALEWVQRFITYFGGDANQITVMGHGSSATTVGLLATSEMARGLFHRVILMSGSPVSPIAIDTNQKLTFAEIALQNSCPSFPTLQFVRCMQKRLTSNVVLADELLTKGRHLGKFRSPLAVIQKEDDARFLPPLIYREPSEQLSQGKFETVPIIIGVTSSEMSGFLSSLAGKPKNMLNSTIFSGTTVLKQFIRAILARSTFGLDSDLVAQLATFEYFSGLNVSQKQEQATDLVEELLSDYLFYVPALSLAKIWSRFSPAHLYVFDYVPTGPGNGEPNGQDPFARIRNKRQGQVNDGPVEDEDNPITQAIHGSDLLFLMEGYKGSAQDRNVANVMVDYFVNFIHKGSPLQSGLEWPQYREDSKEYLFISDQINVKSGFRQRQELFWTELIAQVSERSCPRPTKGRAFAQAVDLSPATSPGHSYATGGGSSSYNFFPR